MKYIMAFIVLLCGVAVGGPNAQRFLVLDSAKPDNVWSQTFTRGESVWLRCDLYARGAVYTNPCGGYLWYATNETASTGVKIYSSYNEPGFVWFLVSSSNSLGLSPSPASHYSQVVITNADGTVFADWGRGTFVTRNGGGVTGVGVAPSVTNINIGTYSWQGVFPESVIPAVPSTLPAGAIVATNQGVVGQSFFYSGGTPTGVSTGYFATASGSGDMLASVYDAAGGARQVAFANDLASETGRAQQAEALLLPKAATNGAEWGSHAGLATNAGGAGAGYYAMSNGAWTAFAPGAGGSANAVTNGGATINGVPVTNGSEFAALTDLPSDLARSEYSQGTNYMVENNTYPFSTNRVIGFRRGYPGGPFIQAWENIGTISATRETTYAWYYYTDGVQLAYNDTDTYHWSGEGIFFDIPLAVFSDRLSASVLDVGTGYFNSIVGNGSSLTNITAAQVGAVATNDARYLAALTNAAAFYLASNPNGYTTAGEVAGIAAGEAVIAVASILGNPYNYRGSITGHIWATSGNVLTNAAAFATAEQGTKADTALQPAATNGWEIGSHTGLVTQPMTNGWEIGSHTGLVTRTMTNGWEIGSHANFATNAGGAGAGYYAMSNGVWTAFAPGAGGSANAVTNGGATIDGQAVSNGAVITTSGGMSSETVSNIVIAVGTEQGWSTNTAWTWQGAQVVPVATSAYTIAYGGPAVWNAGSNRFDVLPFSTTNYGTVTGSVTITMASNAYLASVGGTWYVKARESTLPQVPVSYSLVYSTSTSAVLSAWCSTNPADAVSDYYAYFSNLVVYSYDRPGMDAYQYTNDAAGIVARVDALPTGNTDTRRVVNAESLATAIAAAKADAAREAWNYTPSGARQPNYSVLTIDKPLVQQQAGIVYMQAGNYFAQSYRGVWDNSVTGSVWRVGPSGRMAFEITSTNIGLAISAFSVVTNTAFFTIETNGVVGTPYIEYSADLVAAQWLIAPGQSMVNNTTNWTASCPTVATMLFFRAISPGGANAINSHYRHVFFAGVAGITAADVGAVSNGAATINGEPITNGAAITISGTGGGADAASTNYFRNAVNLTNLTAAGIVTNYGITINGQPLTNGAALTISGTGAVSAADCTNIAQTVVAVSHTPTYYVTNTITVTNSQDFAIPLAGNNVRVRWMAMFLSATNESATSKRASFGMFTRSDRLCDSAIYADTNQLYWAAPSTAAQAAGATTGTVADASGVVLMDRYAVGNGSQFDFLTATNADATTIFWACTNKYATTADANTKISHANYLTPVFFDDDSGQSNAWCRFAWTTPYTGTVTTIMRYSK